MRRQRSIVAFLVAVLLVSCGGPASPGDGASVPVPEGVITGILKEVGGVPLVGEQVTLSLAAPVDAASVGVDELATRSAAVTMTNARGEFAFDVATEGVFTLTNLGDGVGALAHVTVTRRDDGHLVSDGVVGMTAAELGAVTGRVAGKGAGVMVFLSGTSFLALTGADGSFVIGRVPAGTYDAVAGIAGAVGSAVSVTVAPGATAALAQDLRLGPVVTGVTPDGFVPRVIEWPGSGALLAPREYVIRGSGFGSRQGLSRMTYAGSEVPVSAVLSWSDDEIVVDANGLPEVVWERTYRATDFRFTLATVAGEAVTAVTGAFWFEVEATSGLEAPEMTSPVSVAVELRTGVGHPVAGVRVGASAANGVVQSLSGAPITEFETLGVPVSEYEPSLRVQPASWLPVVLLLDPSVDAEVAAGDAYAFVVRGGGLELDTDTFVVGANTFSGRVVAADGVTAMPDDGGFSLRVYTSWSGYYPQCPVEIGVIADEPLTLAGDGSWSAEVELPSGLAGDQVCVGLLYAGLRLDARELLSVD